MMHVETLLAGGYAILLLLVAFVLEWMSAHTHRRSLRFRTAGFSYDEDHDHWVCPEGQHLWPHEFDHERRLVRYKAKAHICNGCPLKDSCTDSNTGREITRPVDPWPHSEAGRFHRGLAVVIAVGASLILVAGLVRAGAAADVALLGGLLVVSLLLTFWLAKDLRRHPAGFPEGPSDGMRVVTAGPGGVRPQSAYASQRRGASSAGRWKPGPGNPGDAAGSGRIDG